MKTWREEMEEVAGAAGPLPPGTFKLRSTVDRAKIREELALDRLDRITELLASMPGGPESLMFTTPRGHWVEARSMETAIGNLDEIIVLLAALSLRG